MRDAAAVWRSGRARRRVLHCVPSMGGGGSERQLAYLAGALTRRGWDVHVALNAGGPNLPMLEAAGATVHYLHGRGNHDPRLFTRLCRLIDVLRPDLVQCWLLQMEIVGGVAAMVKRTPWILSERSSVEAYPPSVKHRLRVVLGARAEAIVANSSAGEEYWRERTGDRLVPYVVPNALPLDAIAAAPVATSAALAIGDDDPLVLFAGRFEPSKNAETLVHALERLSPRLRFRAHFYGDGPQRAYIERLVAARGLDACIRLMGYASDLWSIMKRATVLVSSSRFEGSPNVVLEAMACGCPLVVSDIRAHREILDAKSAVFVDPDHVDGLAWQIEAAIRDSGTARTRAAAASSRVAGHAVAAVGQRYDEIYEHVLSRYHGSKGRRGRALAIAGQTMGS